MRAHPDGFRDEPVPEVEAPDRHQSDAGQSEPNASDASDGARPDAVLDVAHQHLAPPAVAGAGKSAVPVRGDPARGDPVQGACRLALQPAQSAQAVLDAVVALCKQDAGRSVERSCAEPALSAQLRQVALADGQHLVPPARQVGLKQ